MTPKQERALREVSRYSEQSNIKWADSSELCTTPGVMGSLVRLGLVNSCTQREHPLGERPFFYGLYQINQRGIVALAMLNLDRSSASAPPMA